MKTKLIISSAIAGIVALSAATGALAADEKKAEKEKCYGVSKKGANDCGTASHACAGQSKADNAGDEWKYVAKGSCEGMKGTLKAVSAKAADAKPADAKK